ncbi:MAG: competence protein, partial [Mycobacteriaceae bacterium]
MLEQPVDRLDTRLVPAALLAWASVLLGIIAGWQVAAAVAVVAAAAVPLVCRMNHRAVVAGL